MSFLGDFISNLTSADHLWSPTKRWLAVALVILVVISLIMVCQPTTTEYASLFSGRKFTSAELTQIEQAFATAGLSDCQIQDSQVRVPRDQKSTYLASLQGIIEADTLNADMDLALKNSSLWEPRHVKDLKIKHAEEKQLSRMLATMKYIEDVTVRKDEIDIRGLRGNREITALAAVKPTGELQLDSNKANAIRNAVAACYAGLAVDQVTVLDLNSGRVFGGSQEQNLGTKDPYTVQKHQFEQLYCNRVREDLSSEIPGLTVEIYVALNFTNSSDSSEPAPLTTGQGAKTGESEADQASKTPPSATPPSTSKLVPQHVVASITLPDNYYREALQRQESSDGNPNTKIPHSQRLESLKQQTTKTIHDRVTHLLQIPLAADFMAPTAIVHIKDALHSPQLVSNSDNHTSAASSFGKIPWMAFGWILFAVIAAGILIQRVRRNTPTTNPPASESPPQPSALPTPETDQSDAQEPSSLDEQADEPTEQLRSELADRVRKNPQVAVHVLQDWLDDAA